MKSTNKFLNDIKSTVDYVPVESRIDTDIVSFLNTNLTQVNLQQMFTNLDIDGTNGYKYINGTRTITRDIFLKILIYLQNDFDQIQSLLKQYEFVPLYAKNKRDAAIIYCIYNHYSYSQTKVYLAKYKLNGL